MKKIFFLGMLLVFGFSNAQVKFGINGGFASATVSDKYDDLTAGYYAGLFTEIGLGAFALQPAVNYVRINKDSYVQIPVMMKFYFVPKVNLQVGPQFAFRTGQVPATMSKTNFGLAVGLGADLVKGLFIEGRYAFQLNNALNSPPSGQKLHFNLFNVGLGLRLN